MSQFGWGTLASVVAVIVGALLQYAVSRRTSLSTDRHVNFEEAVEIIERLNLEISRKDLENADLRLQLTEWRERCRACERGGNNEI